MRKLIVVLILALVAFIGVIAAPQAQAQEAEVVKLRPFSPQANYMSLPGYLRYLIYTTNGRWISRDEAEERIRAAGGETTAPTGTTGDTGAAAGGAAE